MGVVTSCNFVTMHLSLKCLFSRTRYFYSLLMYSSMPFSVPLCQRNYCILLDYFGATLGDGQGLLLTLHHELLLVSLGDQMECWNGTWASCVQGKCPPPCAMAPAPGNFFLIQTYDWSICTLFNFISRTENDKAELLNMYIVISCCQIFSICNKMPIAVVVY